MKCIGYGKYENNCNNEAGSSHSDHWCQRCDDIRIETISKSLNDILNGMNKEKDRIK